MKTARWLLEYLTLLLVTVPVGMFIWIKAAPGRMYYCWDEVPPIVISWFPPFIHPEANSLDGALVDHYIWPGWAVHLCWGGLAVIMLLLPAAAVWARHRLQGWRRLDDVQDFDML